MPREGYRSISVKDCLFERLKEKAENEHRTIPEMIENLMTKEVS
jgi:hypothetical protein